MGRLSIVVLLFGWSVYSQAQTTRKPSVPSIRDASRVAVPLRTAASLRDICQAFVRLQSARDANDIRHVNDTDYQEAGHCMGYVTGWVDTVNEQLSCEDGRLYTTKLIGEPKVSQLIKIFLQYVGSHPEREQERAAEVLERALGEKGMLGAFAVDFSECKR